MTYDPSKGIFGNISQLFTERDKTNKRIDTNYAEQQQTISEMDEMFLDQEERLIMLEIGE